MSLEDLNRPPVLVESSSLSGWIVRATLESTWNTALTKTIAVNAGEICVLYTIIGYGTTRSGLVSPYADDGCRARALPMGVTFGTRLLPNVLQIVTSGNLKILNTGSGPARLFGCILTPTWSTADEQDRAGELPVGPSVGVSGGVVEFEELENGNFGTDVLLSVPVNALIVATGAEAIADMSVDAGTTATYSELWGGSTSLGNPPGSLSACVARITGAGLFNIEQGGTLYPYRVIKPRAGAIVIS